MSRTNHAIICLYYYPRKVCNLSESEKISLFHSIFQLRMFFQTGFAQVRSVIRSRNQLLFVSNKYYHHLSFWCNVGLFGAMNCDYFLVTQVHFLGSHKCLMCSVLTTIIIFLNTIINHMIHHSNHPAIVHQLLNNQTVVFQVFCSHHCAYDTSTDSSYVCC